MSAAGVIAGLGSLAQIAGSYYTNMQNAKNQLAINKNNIGMQYAFNADQIAVAQMNNQTQIDMANTAHQREVQDLRDANLNPILSATGGNGAAMPSLNNPSGMDAPSMSAYVKDNPLREFGTSAKEIGRLMTAEYKADVMAKEADALYSQRLAQAQGYQNELLRNAAYVDYYESNAKAVQARSEARAWERLIHPSLHEDNTEGNPGSYWDHYVHDGSWFHKQYKSDDKGTPIIGPDGKPLLLYESREPVLIDHEFVDAIAKGIKADISENRWKAVHHWIDSGAKAASAAAKVIGSVKGGPTGDIKFGKKSY